ncbi:serine hydrolase [Parablastomonas sp. CN1-191]|uniref:serine hydrolase n=1 Tax=Parablastomonas sp. CN1-191 TaxID=3400908 RepID=UPI003BF8FA6B
MLRQRADELVALLNGGGDPAAMFAPEFLAQVPEASIRALSGQVTGSVGKAVRIASFEPVGPNAARLVMAFERGTAPMTLATAPDAAGRIVGLRILGVETAADAALTSLDAVADAMSALPGKANFAAFDLGDGPAKALTKGLNPRDRLAIGSTFKLAVLATLLREVDAGKRSWDDAVVLGGVELPGGRFTASPAGTAVPLRTLAEAMISVSDNSATDALIHALGRERIEATLPLLGWMSPANRPFLTTMELFKLKGVEGGALGTRYLAAGEKAKRAMLAGEVAALPGSAVGGLFADGKPVRIDSLEWFASPVELATAMEWFRRHGGSPAGKEALRILALNPGPLAGMKAQFPYVGYKGGSEPGVISMTLLVQDKAGGWHALTAGWNDPAAAVDETRFAALVQRAAAIVAGP